MPRINSFGNSINVKKISSGNINNINSINNNNVGLLKANIPINNMIPNAATFNPHLSKMNELNKINNENQINNANPILASRNINMAYYPQGQPPINNNPQLINNSLNNPLLNEINILKDSSSAANKLLFCQI